MNNYKRGLSVVQYKKTFGAGKFYHKLVEWYVDGGEWKTAHVCEEKHWSKCKELLKDMKTSKVQDMTLESIKSEGVNSFVMPDGEIHEKLPFCDELEKQNERISIRAIGYTKNQFNLIGELKQGNYIKEVSEKFTWFVEDDMMQRLLSDVETGALKRLMKAGLVIIEGNKITFNKESLDI